MEQNNLLKNKDNNTLKDIGFCLKTCLAGSGKLASCMRTEGHEGKCSKNVYTIDKYGNYLRW